MDNTEKKDWFGLYYSNQDKNYTDFLQNGITSSNIELKSKDEYKKNDKIIQAFTLPDGKFDEVSFDNFYNKALLSYNTFSLGEFKEENLPKIEYDLMSPFKSQLDQTQKISLDIIKIGNPFIKNIGINTVLGVTKTSMSVRELAQQNRIYDSVNNKWLDKTPEDLGFWGTITNTPIVLAQYDEDTEEIDPETGRKILYKKGEIKVDKEGRPYYETLGNREVHGKQVLSAFDVITRENSSWNKFDFFDNDGKESSIGATVAQTIASVIPFFIPVVNKAYTSALILREGTKLGITLYKMMDSLINNNRPGSDFGILNTIEGKAYQFNTSVSDKSQEKMLTFENFGKLVSDVGSQLFQQRLLASIPKMLGIGDTEKAAIKAIRKKYGTEILNEIADGSIIKNRGLYKIIVNSDPAIINTINKAAIRNNILGRFMANFYMSGISTMDVYNDALDAGYDRRTAAITAGLAMGATTWMIQSTEIGQKALEGLGFGGERATIRNATKKILEENRDKLHFLANNPTDKTAFNSLLLKFANTYKKVTSPINTIIESSGVLSNAVSEGIEEMSEEAIMDLSKALTDAFTGITGTQKNASFDFLASRPLERYFMAGFGGAIGGAIFRVANNLSEVNNNIPDKTKEDILYLIRNGRKSELIDQLEKYREQGVAPKNLSATEYEVNDNNTINYKPSKGIGDSQNDALIDLTIQLINQWDSVINEESINLTDEELIKTSALRDSRLEDLIKYDGRFDIIKDYNTISKEIGELAIEKKDIENQLNAPGKDIPNKTELENKLNKVNTLLEEKRLEKNKLLSGENLEEYIKKVLFNLSDISKKIYSTDIYTYTENLLGKSYASLSETEKEDIKERFKKYREDDKEKFDQAYKIFKSISDKYGNDIVRVISKIPSLNKLKIFLSKIDEENLYSLDQEAKRNFDLSRNLGIELGVPVTRGIDYLFEWRNLDLNSYDVKSLINNFFNNIKLNGINYNLNLSDIINDTDNSSELIDIIYSTLSNLQSTLNNAVSENKNIREEFIKFVNENVKYNSLKNLLLNINNNIQSNSTQEYINELNNILNELDFNINFILIPKLKDITVSKIISSIKNEGLEITKDLYQYLKNYIKSDNKVDIDFKDYTDGVLSYLSESLSSNPDINYDLGNIKNVDKDLYNDIVSGLSETLNINNIDEFIRVSKQLTSAKDWFDVADILNKSELTDDEKSVVIDNINYSNKSKTKSTLDEINNILSPLIINQDNLFNNPINELLSKIYLDIDPESSAINIFELLSNENDLLKSTNNLSDYVLQGKIKSEQIDAAINIINALQSVVASMQNTTYGNGGYGFNSTLNYVREKTGIKDKFPEIESNLAYNTISELESIKSRLNFYKQLSEQNKGNKLKEHKLTAIKTRQALLKNFQDKIFRKEQPELFDGIDDIISNYDITLFSKSDLTDDEYIKLEKLISQIEDKLYDNAQKLSDNNIISKEQIIINLFKNYNYSELMKEAYNNPDSLNSEINTLSPTDLFIYYHTILSLKASNFNNALKEVVNELLNTINPIIPIFSQEYAARIAIAFIVNPNLMNNITNLNRNFEDSISNDVKKDKYKNLISVLKNLVFINGAPGVGKTVGVDSLVYKITNKLLGEQEIIISGPGSQQVINLLNSIIGTNYDSNGNLNNINNNLSNKNVKVLTASQLLSNILVSPEIIVKANEQFKNYKSIPENERVIEKLETKDEEPIYRLKRNYLTESNFKSGIFENSKLIFIDEVTQLSKFELELLSSWAELNNKIIITSGDLLQSGFSDNNGAYLGIDVDTNLIYTPTLTTSLRITNIHKKDNQDSLRVLTSRVRDNNNFYTTGEFNFDLGIKIALSNYESMPSLKYYEDDSILNGEKIVSSISESDIDKLVKNSNEPIGFIYDNVNSETYKLIDSYLSKHPGSIRKFKLEEVQGFEAKYFIVDKKFNFGSSGSMVEKATRDLYTALTRSKEGTIIINNGLTSYLTKGSEKINYTQNSLIDNEAAKSFSELRLKALNSSIGEVSNEKINNDTRENKQVSHPNVKLGEVLDIAFSDEEKNKEKLQQIEKLENTGKYPKDNFICYSYRTRIKPEIKLINNIETYSIKDSAIVLRLDNNCEHKAFFNGEVDNLSKSDFEKVDDRILEIKSILYNYKKDLRNKLFKEQGIESAINDLFNDLTGNSGYVDLSNGKFRLKATKYITKSNNINKEDSVIRIIYEIPIIDSNKNIQTIELYIAELPNINNPDFLIKDSDTEKQKEGKKWFIEYQKFYGEVMNRFSLGESNKENYYIDLKDNFELDRITNSVIYKGSDKKQKIHVSFNDKDKEFKGIYFSKPYIVTNTKYGNSNRNEILYQRNEKLNSLYNDYYTLLSEYNTTTIEETKNKLKIKLDTIREQINNEVSKNNIKGKAVVFITHSKYIFDEDGNIITEDQFGDHYIKELNGEFNSDSNNKDKIRMVILNPEGQTFTSFISKYREFINSYKKDSGVSKYSGKFYKSYFGDFIGFDILLSIYNYYNYLKAIGKPESKHIKIGEKLLKSLSSLSSKEGNVNNPFDLPGNKLKFNLPHVIKIMERLHTEVTDENIKKMENYASVINGNDVIKFLNKIIEFKINQRLHPGLNVFKPIINDENGGIFQDWDKNDNISDLDILDFMEFAISGKRLYKEANGETRIIEAPNYNPLFKDGIYPFPIYELTDKNSNYTGGEYFYEARIPDGEYYIDRDLQTPLFTFQPSRDLNNPENFGINRDNSNPPSSPNDSNQKKSITNINTVKNKIQNIIGSELYNLSYRIINDNFNPYISENENIENIINKIVDNINTLAKQSNIEYNSDNYIESVSYNNNNFDVSLRKKPQLNNNENISNFEKNKLSLQEIYGDLFEPITDINDIKKLINITDYIKNNLDQNLINYIITSNLDNNIINLINSNNNVRIILSDINKLRSKYNIC